MKFIFGGSLLTPRPDKSHIYKEHVRGNNSLIEIDMDHVQKQLNARGVEVAEKDIEELTKAVVFSIWRLQNWESTTLTTSLT